MGYSLGDDRESFDVFEQTNLIVEKIGKELQKNGWKYNKEDYCFEKDDRVLTLDISQDHVNSIYISDSKIDYLKFCNKHSYFEPIYDGDEVCEISTYVSNKTDIKDIVSKIQNAPLIEKNKDLEL